VGDKGEAVATGWPATQPTRLQRVPTVASQVDPCAGEAAIPGGELPTDSEDDIVTDEYEDTTMCETQPQRAPLQRYMVRSWVRALWVGCILVLVNCNIKVKPRLCMQAKQLSMMSNEAAF
jgi:hypothetical protein